MSGFLDIGFGHNDDNLNDRVDRFKAKAGETYRLSFALWSLDEEGILKMEGSPRFIGARRLYVEGVGYFISHGPEYEKLAGKPAKMSIGTIVVNWPVDPEGVVEKEKLTERHVKVQPWVFSNDKYEVIKRRNSNFPLSKYDLQVTCTDTKYQKMDISPCGDGNLLGKIMGKPSGLRDHLLSQIERVAEKLAGTIASDLSLDQIRERLTGVSTPAPVASVNPVDIDSRLDDLLV